MQMELTQLNKDIVQMLKYKDRPEVTAWICWRGKDFPTVCKGSFVLSEKESADALAFWVHIFGTWGQGRLRIL